MNCRPIIFSGAMVRAILQGRKTQTRRVVKPHPKFPQHNICVPSIMADPWSVWFHGDVTDRVGVAVNCHYGKPGDRLWCKETWAQNENQVSDSAMDTSIVYRADGEERALDNGTEKDWSPAIFMLRRASRITLEIVSVRVERVQDISGRDILLEGAVLRAHDDQFGHNPVSAFDGKCYMDLKSLWAAGWDSINGKKHPWASNPWVWVLEFKRA